MELIWSVYREGGNIKLVTETGKVTFIEKSEYEIEVYRISDEIEAFYMQCRPKIVPEDTYKRNGYTAFWNEWHRRRNKQ